MRGERAANSLLVEAYILDHVACRKTLSRPLRPANFGSLVHEHDHYTSMAFFGDSSIIVVT